MIVADGDGLAAIEALVRERGERQVIADLDIPRSTLARCLAGLPVYAGTQLLVRERLDALVTP